MTRRRRLVVIVGPTYSGKSTVAAVLARAGYFVVSARRTLASTLASERMTRKALIKAGADLEHRTQGAWLADAVATSRTRRSVVVDSARTRSQLTSLQRLARTARYRCVTIYVTAAEPVRRRRFDLARTVGSDFEMKEWRRLASQELEARTKRLRSAADIVIDTTRLSRRDLGSLVRSLVVR